MGINRNNPQHAKLHVLLQPNIGLDGDARHSVVEILNTFLADEAVLTMKTRSAYWNVRGPGHLDLQELFDRQFHELNLISNEVAERVCVLGGLVINSFEDFLKYSRLEEHSGDTPDVMNLLADHEASIRYLREDAHKCFEEFEDHGTFGLLLGFIRQHEKMAWMLRSCVEPELPLDEIALNKVIFQPR